MAYGEPQLQDWDVQYRIKLFHTASNGYLELVSGTQIDNRDELVSTAVQAALDVLSAGGFTVEQAYKTCVASQAITATPVEE